MRDSANESKQAVLGHLQRATSSPALPSSLTLTGDIKRCILAKKKVPGEEADVNTIFLPPSTFVESGHRFAPTRLLKLPYGMDEPDKAQRAILQTLGLENLGRTETLQNRITQRPKGRKKR